MIQHQTSTSKLISVQELYQLFNHLQIEKKEHQLLPNMNVNNEIVEFCEGVLPQNWDFY